MSRTSTLRQGIINGPVKALARAPTSLEGKQLIHFLWGEAVNRYNLELTKDDGKQLNTTAQQQVSFEVLLASAAEAKKITEDKKYPFTNTVQRIVGVFNQYAIAGDIIVQHHAEYTSIAWGAFRFLLLFAVQEGKTGEALISALDLIAQTVFRAGEYAKHFANTGSSANKILDLLRTDLIYLYAEALNLLVRANIFFRKSTFRRYSSAGFKPFDTKFKGILDLIKDYESRVQKDIDLLRTERENIREEYENGVWLLAADFTVELQKLQNQHLDRTGEWFLQNDKVKHWIDLQSTGFLWVQGKAGSGKSTLAALLIRHLLLVSNAPVLNVFCKTGEENKDTLLSVLRNIIFQLLERGGDSYKALHRITRDARLSSKSQNAQSVPMDVLWAILRQQLRVTPGCFCIIDGLDECNSSSDEVLSFIDRLTRVVNEASQTTRIAIISRLDRPDIDLWQLLRIENSDVKDDIELFITVKLRDSPVLSRKSAKINSRLQRALVDGSEGMILWASLMIPELEAGHWTPFKVFEKPPNGLLEMYRSILLRLTEASNYKEISKILHTVIAAFRPLRLDEFVFSNAMLVGASDEIHEHYSKSNTEDEAKILVNKVSPLITVMPDGTIQLVHASLKDCLLGQDLQSMAKQKQKLSHFSFDSRRLHELMAGALVSYLSLRCFAEDIGNQDPVALHNMYPLLEYASRNFIEHLTQTRDVLAETTQLVVNFFASTQGWRWLQNLQDLYDLSLDHLQVLQSHLSGWMGFLPDDTVAEWKHHCLNRFFLSLNEKRFEETRKLGTNNPFVIRAMVTLADAYSGVGRWKEAEDLQLQVLAARKKVLGDDHPDTLASMNSLAMTYSDQGRWKEAEDLQQQVLAARKKVLGDDHPDTPRSMNNLANMYSKQGRWKEAEDLQLQVLAGCKKVLGDDHPDTLTSMSNLAIMYSDQGRWKEAEDLQQQVLAARKKVLGDDYPDTLTSMDILAMMYFKQGRRKEAEDLQLQVLAARKKVLGDDYPDTLTSMNNLANMYSDQGRWKEAEDLRLQVLAACKKVLGDDHPDTLTSMNNLAMMYSKQGRWKEAEDLQQQVLAARKKVLGDDYPDTLTSMSNLAIMYSDQGRWKEAEDLQQQVLAARKKVLGDDHPDTLASMNNLANTYSKQGRWKEAEDLQLQVLAACKKVLGDDHPDPLTSMNNLARMYSDQGRWKEAEDLQLQVLAARKKVLGDDHPDTLETMRSLAITYSELGRDEEARILRESADK